MRESRPRQLGLFDDRNTAIELPAVQRIAALALLAALLTEAIAAGIEAPVVEPQEIGDDAHHG